MYIRQYILSLCIYILLSVTTTLYATHPDYIAGKKITVSGHITDADNGEHLIGATIVVRELRKGTSTNSYGFYSISLDAGTYTLDFSYVGYRTINKTLKIEKDVLLNIELSPDVTELEEIEIRTDAPDRNIKSTEMSVQKLEMKEIRQIPSFMGEVDVLKAIQLLPGVSFLSEGASGFSVRGGGPDQNLILLDEATVYSASHFMGFFSVFNNDAIKSATIYKGDIPAQYGGRLSSLVDVRMRDGNAKKIQAQGGLGTVSSRLTVEGPLFNEKTTFLAAGRRTYTDVLLMFAKDTLVKQNKVYFYDLNAKVSHTVNPNNRIFMSAYNGSDVFKSPFGVFTFGNSTFTGRWNHLFSGRLFSNFTFVTSNYQYALGSERENDPTAFEWKSAMQDQTGEADFTWFLNTSNEMRFGIASTYHVMNQGMISGKGDSTIIKAYHLPLRYALQHGAYISNEQKVSERITLKYGLRLSVFQNMGKDTVIRYDKKYVVKDTLAFGHRNIYNTYTNPEPRVGINYLLDDFSSLKVGYSRMAQYLQLASNSRAGFPLDIWFPAGLNVKPQLADQYAIGYFRNFAANSYESSVELFYKDIRHVIDFKDFAQLLLNKDLEKELRYGQGYAYGAEFIVRKQNGRLTGWIAYTYTRAMRSVKTINNDNEYPSPYDKPHDFTIVCNYNFSKQLSFGATWLYSTGLPGTFPVGKVQTPYGSYPLYTDKRNADRFPDYHRMDISITYSFLKYKARNDRKEKWGELNLSVYNAYNRKNIYMLNFDPDKEYAEKIYFPLLPALTCNFLF